MLPDGTPPFYRGHEGFNNILADQRLARPGRAIRVYNYGGPAGNEKLYVIGTESQLFDAATGRKVHPVDVLSRTVAPDGWSVEGLELSLLPEAEINKVLGISSPQ
ncbi:MAG: hypothetical protein AABX85_04645 [Nanoarchaeota archaeon]